MRFLLLLQHSTTSLVVPPRQGKGSDKTLGLYLRYRGDSDRVCVRFCLSMLSTVTGGPQQAWRSPGVVTFGKEAVKGSLHRIHKSGPSKDGTKR